VTANRLLELHTQVTEAIFRAVSWERRQDREQSIAAWRVVAELERAITEEGSRSGRALEQETAERGVRNALDRADALEAGAPFHLQEEA